MKKKNYIHKIYPAVLMTMIICSIGLLSKIVNAAENNFSIVGNTDDSTLQDTKTQDAKIEYISNSYFYVTIPKKITLDGNTKQGSYFVKVSGDIASNQAVSVIPRDEDADVNGTNFYMRDASSGNKDHTKTPIIADVIQSKKIWNYQDTKESVISNDNIVSAPNLTAGSWQGSLVFMINLKQVVTDDVTNPKMSFLSEDGAILDMDTFFIRMGESKQVSLSLADGLIAQDAAVWESDNPTKIIVNNGLITLTDEAQVGDTANISVSVPTTTDILHTSFIVTVKAAATYALAPEGAINNWNYALDETNDIVTLNYYTGNETDVIVYGSYPVNTSEGGKTYRTQLASNIENANYNTPYMFNGYKTTNCKNIHSIKFSDAINTSNITNMSYMFQNCSSLTSVDLSSFDTSNVTNMSNMFYGCSSLTSLDLSSFNTSNMTNMSSMFSSCSTLTSLDVSNFNTSNMTNMGWMFTGCVSLTSLDLSSFDTSKVTNMIYTFNSCTNLKTIYATSGKWVTSLAESTIINGDSGATGMFDRCGTKSVTYR